MAIEPRDLDARLFLRHIVVPAGENFEELVGGDETVQAKEYDPETQTWHVLCFRARLTPESKALLDEERKTAELSAENNISSIVRP